MNLIEELKEYKDLRNSIVTIGVFDGVHLGHQNLISQVVNEANIHKLCPTIITFVNHPASILRNNFTTEFICSLEERIRLLKLLSVEQVIPISFDKQVANLSAEHFIGFLQKTIKMEKMVIGPDFAMGRNRSGSSITLPKLADKMGFQVKSIKSVTDTSNAHISSTSIRKQIKQGDFQHVNSQLGRTYSLDGTVIQGMKRGRQLGFPTANLQLMNAGIVIPPDGIYATRTLVDNKSYLSATSIGSQPTFAGNKQTVESYIIGFSKDIYGKSISIQFEKRLRDQKYFESISELKKQMSKDIEETQIILSN
ncbi:MAG: bifunctional riboflavin kinase/FAD synthetase [SAR202 cluster bacterium]|nr:bifunctional riboflavin kinase/FMN adenylyltransferase [Chloroflexota bacterium]MQG39591.1 bifunctional riboflavin kinase/FAD synthetase [SAR202 cluster bacterium]|tara:strand:- start:2198 stop:3124 length:927 start_codon:yes stop_codon:yes gene_type:complete